MVLFSSQSYLLSVSLPYGKVMTLEEYRKIMSRYGYNISTRPLSKYGMLEVFLIKNRFALGRVHLQEIMKTSTIELEGKMLQGLFENES